MEIPPPGEAAPDAVPQLTAEQILVALHEATVAVHEAVREATAAVRSQGSALGMCSLCLAAYLRRGTPVGETVRPAVVWAAIPAQLGGSIPVCVPHFGVVMEDRGSQLVAAAPGDVPPPSGSGLIVPGR